MNEKRIEISLAKLRKLWLRTKTAKGKAAILFTANTLKQGISGALIPLTLKQGHKDSVINCVMGFSDAVDYEHHGCLNPVNY